MLVTKHVCRRRATCSNCNRPISRGDQMMTARTGNMTVCAHVVCPPVLASVHDSPVIRIAGVK